MENLTITSPFAILTKRETEVLILMLQGAQVKEISASLELKSNIFTKKRARELKIWQM